jgi:predicted dehydrogenase
MTDALGLGVVGAGALSLRVLRHLALPDVADAVRVVNVCDPAEGRAAAAADRFGIPRSCASLEALLADAAVEAVTIASPIGLHYQQGLEAIRAGRHVHFNKTMSVTTDEATHLIEEARARRVQIVPSPGEVLFPHLDRTRQMIAAGDIGELCWAACGAAFNTYHFDEPERHGSGPLENINPSWYFRNPGGGPLFDRTVYSLHRLTTVLGGVQRVTAMSGVRIAEREFGGRRISGDAHDNTLMLLDFGESVFAFAYGTAAGLLAGGDFDADGWYYGTTGSILGRRHGEHPLAYPGSDVADNARGEDGLVPLDGTKWLLPHVVGEHRTLDESHVFADVMQLVDAVRTGNPSRVTPERARHVIEIIEAAYEAAATGQTQTLRTTLDGIRT